jgi:hypothetical protein
METFMLACIIGIRFLLVLGQLAAAAPSLRPLVGLGAWDATLDGWRAGAVVPPTATLGEPIRVSIRITNLTAGPKQITAVPPRTTRAIILDEHGHRIPPRPSYRWIEQSRGELNLVQVRMEQVQPGAAWTDSVDIQQVYALDAPGHYWVMVGQRVGHTLIAPAEPTVWAPPQPLRVEPKKGTASP